MNKDKSIMEAIALKHVPCRCDESYKSRGLEAPDCPYHSTDPQEAMKEWAKQQAIAFATFCNENYLYRMDDLWYRSEDSGWGSKTDAELYELFLQSQNTQS